MRIGISLALSALVSQVVCAEVCPSTASASSTEDLTINSGETCEITTTKNVKSSITNNGTLILKSGITFQNGGNYTITSNDNSGFGTILVKNSVTIDASSTATTTAGATTLLDSVTTTATTSSLTIDSQDITIDKNRTLTLKATTITLGGSATDGTSTGTSSAIGLAEATTTDKHTSITGDSSIPTSTSTKNVVLSTTTTLNTKDLILKNARIDGGSTLQNLKNTKLELNGGFITSNSTSGLTLSAENGSTFAITGASNSISSGTNELKIQGEHSFSGSGTLDFIGSTITLGNDSATKLTLKTDSSENTPKLGFQASTKLLFKSVENTGLTLQVIGGGDSAVAHNISSTFSGGTLQAINTSDKDQVLVIENGNDEKSFGIGKIEIKDGENTPTTFLGSGIEIYGQSITINGSTDSNTLVLKTIEDKGEIILSRKNSNAQDTQNTQNAQNTQRDGDVLIKGSTTSKNLQLRGVQTTIGGNVTLQKLNIQTQSSDEGMVFVGGDSSVLTLSDVTLTSGIADEDNQNYQSLSFTSDTRSTILVNKEASDPTAVNFKASSLAFTNQDISLASVGSGGSLNLYSYGNVALSDKSGSGVGNFAFENTTISDGSGASLNLYSAERAKVLANGLTLNNVTLTTYKIDTTKTNGKNAIDLSDTSSDMTTQGSVKIDTNKFFYGGDTQGIGMDITIIGGSGGDGKLTLTSETEGESFTFGGTLTIDNSSASSVSNPQIEIELNGKKNNDSQQDIDLKINGGLTAKGNATGGTTTTLKAKSFIFGEGSVVSSINGTLSLSAGSGNENIDLTKALTRLQGVSSAEATISKGTGNLSLGDVEATGKTKITDATFNNSNITISALGSDANTLAITDDSKAISGISSLNLQNSNLVVVQTTSNIQPFLIVQSPQSGITQDLKFNDKATITSNGDSSIIAKTIKAGESNGKLSLNIQSGTLTYTETDATAGDAIGSVALGLKGKQGGNLVLSNNGSNTYHTFKAPEISSNNDSTITAKDFSFNDSGATISATGGELKLIAKTSSPDTLTIKQGTLALDNASLSYYYTNGSETLGKMTLHNDSTSVAITSTGTSSIQAQDLDLKGNTITSSEGVLTLQGVKEDSTLGDVSIGNFGGLTITSAPKTGSSETSLTDIKLTSTLTLTANAPYTSSASPLGGGKFGVLQAQSVAFSQNGGADSPLIFIKVLDKPLEGEELFTLQEGGQVVVQTSNGITKGNSTGKANNQAITLEDISLDNGGYKSLSLTAELVPDSKTTTQVNAIKVLLSVAQSSASEITESISDNLSKVQMQTLLTQGDRKSTRLNSSHITRSRMPSSA